jgi:hypothetical protein
MSSAIEDWRFRRPENYEDEKKSRRQEGQILEAIRGPQV